MIAPQQIRGVLVDDSKKLTHSVTVSPGTGHFEEDVLAGRGAKAAVRRMWLGSWFALLGNRRLGNRLDGTSLRMGGAVKNFVAGLESLPPLEQEIRRRSRLRYHRVHCGKKTEGTKVHFTSTFAFLVSTQSARAPMAGAARTLPRLGL